MNRLAFLISLGLTLSPSVAAGKSPPVGEIEGNMPGASGKTYKMYVPPSHALPTKPKFALLVYLHAYRQEPRIRDDWKRLADRNGIIILAPHCAREAWFGRPDNPNIMALIEIVLKTYRIDRRSIYLAGVSQGALQLFYLLDEHPNIFRAAASFLMSCPADVSLPAGFPLYMAAGVQDKIIPIDHVRQSVERLKSLGVKVEYVEHPDKGHNVPFKLKEIWDWFQRVAPRGKRKVMMR